jgi:hypothetical protein
MRIGEKTNMPDDELMPVEMLARLLELKKRTSAALGAEPELSKLIDSAIESNNLATGQLALNAFNRQPDETLQRIMNGWRPPVWLPVDLASRFQEDDIRVALEIRLWSASEEDFIIDRSGDELQDGTRISAATNFVIRRDAWPVRIEILEGTKREDALRWLAAAMKKLETGWDELIAAAPEVGEQDEDDEAQKRFEWWASVER